MPNIQARWHGFFTGQLVIKFYLSAGMGWQIFREAGLFLRQKIQVCWIRYLASSRMTPENV